MTPREYEALIPDDESGKTPSYGDHLSIGYDGSSQGSDNDNDNDNDNDSDSQTTPHISNVSRCCPRTYKYKYDHEDEDGLGPHVSISSRACGRACLLLVLILAVAVVSVAVSDPLDSGSGIALQKLRSGIHSVAEALAEQTAPVGDPIAARQGKGPYELIEAHRGTSFFDYYEFHDGPDSIGSAGYNSYVGRKRAEKLDLIRFEGDDSNNNNDNDNNNNNDNDNDNNGGNNQNAGNNNNEENQEGNGNVVVADDEAVNVSGGEEDRASKTTEKPGTGIPHTWLSAGFQLSECGTGLCIPSPKAEDIPFFAWRRQQVNDQRNAVPPPYHCKSLTAVSSLVTALLYSGATIQGDQIGCASGRPPWVSLTIEERKREFESRLADALSVLIFVAAKASRKRKQKAYWKALRRSKGAAKNHREYSELLRDAIAERKASLAAAGAGKENDNSNNNNNNNNDAKSETGKNDNDTDAKEAATEDERSAKRAALPHERIDLIPATVWFNFPVAAAARAGDGPLYKKELRVISSWSNIRDIKLYVQSNTRAFTEKAGIALFLEAIVAIHGNDVIARQLSRCAVASRASAAAAVAASAMPASPSVNTENEGNATFPTGSNPREGDQANASDTASAFAAAERCSLIRCTCEDRQKKLHEEKPLPLNVRIDPNNLLDTTPDGTECASTELLTLLLTGKVRSDWTLCNAGELGIGLLMDTDEEVARTMARPKRPVWLLRGETCYSVLTVEGYWRCGTATNARSSGEDITTISRVDKPGVPLSLVHWNGWYGQRGKTEMRLIASAPEPNEEIPAKKRLRKYSLESSSGRPLSAEPVSTVSLLLMKKRRHESLVNAICGREHACNQEKQQRNPIRAHELERIHMSEEDQKLYPNNHKMWRFDMGVKSNAKVKNSKKDDDDDYRWVPYYRLLPREKLLVETKLGPKIKTILWTRWPGAVIDHFAPQKGGHPVV